LADFDLFIAGGGPAGCATAIALADFAPELSVCLAGPLQRSALRIGETVPPPIKSILDHLGLWLRFSEEGHCASYRTVSAWGGPELGSNEFLLQSHQVGWRLDRAKFDRMLVEAAARRVARHLPAKVTDLAYRDGHWHIACSGEGRTLTARFAVDATGRAAALARFQRWRPVTLDKLVGCFMHFEGGTDNGEGLMIETFSEGWWYTAAIPDGRRVIACMSDADVVCGLDLGRTDSWMEALSDTRHVRATVSEARPLGPPKLRPAGSRRLAGDACLPLICVGDAASCFDPISSLGIIKALRSGIFASYAIADWLRRADDQGVTRYRLFVKSEFAAYWRTLHGYYTLEQRWPNRPFWRRRHSPSSGDRTRI
jgi:flavin-dependent dehydrogenase